MGVGGEFLETDPRGELLDGQSLQCVWTLLGLPLLCAERYSMAGFACSSAWPGRFLTQGRACFASKFLSYFRVLI